MRIECLSADVIPGVSALTRLWGIPIACLDSQKSRRKTSNWLQKISIKKKMREIPKLMPQFTTRLNLRHFFPENFSLSYKNSHFSGKNFWSLYSRVDSFYGTSRRRWVTSSSIIPVRYLRSCFRLRWRYEDDRERHLILDAFTANSLMLNSVCVAGMIWRFNQLISFSQNDDAANDRQNLSYQALYNEKETRVWYSRDIRVLN